MGHPQPQGLHLLQDRQHLTHLKLQQQLLIAPTLLLQFPLSRSLTHWMLHLLLPRWHILIHLHFHQILSRLLLLQMMLLHHKQPHPLCHPLHPHLAPLVKILPLQHLQVLPHHRQRLQMQLCWCLLHQRLHRCLPLPHLPLLLLLQQQTRLPQPEPQLCCQQLKCRPPGPLT